MPVQQSTTLAGIERQGRDQRRGKRRVQHPSTLIVPQDAASAAGLIVGAQQARARRQVREGFAALTEAPRESAFFVVPNAIIHGPPRSGPSVQFRAEASTLPVRTN